MTILDSGTRRVFTDPNTGEELGVRDVNEDKGRCDLLPLVQVGRFMQCPITTYIGHYVETGDKRFIEDAMRFFVEQFYSCDMFTAMLELSRHYSEGCQKYGERNWQKGIYPHCYVDSGVRHLLKALRGDDDEDHKRAFLWNMMGLLWTQENKPELNDLPFKEVLDNVRDNKH